ncbi:MAG: ABC transporter ATP-binding protein [Actinomycetota bacterium]|nr:ABC transporter ATP-binding protein [Actinomycetota bacterium]
MLEVDAIDVFYGDAQALHGLSLSVEEGETVTLLGSNGAGKTTTMRAIAGLRAPSSGDIRLDGESLLRVAPYRRAELGLALVPEGRELWSQMTVRENLELGAFTHSARKSRSDSLDKVFVMFPRLQERSGQLAGSLSGGEQQMCAIGRALMTRPRLLMLDEPSLGLAPMLVTLVFDTVRRLHEEEGLTILLVEQNLHKALGVADRGYVIETGRVKLQGASSELLSDDSVRSAYLGI